MEEQPEKKKTLYETLQDIESYIKEQKEKGEKPNIKKWRPPRFKTGLSMGKKKAGWIICVALGENNSVTFTKARIDEGVVMVNDTPHYITSEDIFIYKNKLPMAIIPQWDERALSSKAYKELVDEKGRNSVGYRFIMNYLHKSQITEKKKIGGGLIIIGILALVGLGYYLYRSGAFS